MLILSSFLATLPSILRSRAALELENLALRHQIGVLQRSAASRPKLVPWDRLLWIGLSRLWRDWRSALAIVRPETSYLDRKSTRLNSSHEWISYAVFCLKKKKETTQEIKLEELLIAEILTLVVLRSCVAACANQVGVFAFFCS